MKQLARVYFWWPKLYSEIETIARECSSCQESAKLPSSPKVVSWSWPTGPWKRLHVDFAGPFLGKMFLVVVDAFSKYFDVIPMTSATSANTIQALRHLFRYFGLPEHLVSDNGSQFTSYEFKAFLASNDISHTLTSPGHPATNGLAERYVGYFKHKLTQMHSRPSTLTADLDRLLFTYCTTPSAIGKTPAELLMNRQPRIKLGALRVNSSKQVRDYDVDVSPKFSVAQAVFVLNYNKGRRWLPGQIVKVLSARNYDVQVGDVIIKRHESQLRSRSIPTGVYDAQFMNLLSPIKTLTTYQIMFFLRRRLHLEFLKIMILR
ncbi:Uncharacterised protein g5157 [Pycnogonum litorale]